MYYINLLIVAFILTSCASTNESTSSGISGTSPLIQSEEDISRYKKAITLLNNNKLEAAKEIFIELNSERPELAGPYANLAVIAYKNNNPEKALELVNISVEKNPKLAQALNFLAFLEQGKGKINLALKYYKQAIENKENYAIAHYNIALLYDIYLQDINSALPHYEKYLKLINNKDKNTVDWVEQLKRSHEKG